MTMNVNDVFPTNEQAAQTSLDTTQCDVVFHSYERNSKFYAVCLLGTRETGYKTIGAIHPLTKKPVVFPSRRAADRYCDLLNMQVIAHV